MYGVVARTKYTHVCPNDSSTSEELVDHTLPGNVPESYPCYRPRSDLFVCPIIFTLILHKQFPFWLQLSFSWIVLFQNSLNFVQIQCFPLRLRVSLAQFLAVFFLLEISPTLPV